jgi:hypothetical protein
MTVTTPTSRWAPNTRAALAISAAAIADLLLPAALALTGARALRKHRVSSADTARRRGAHP